MTIEVRLKELNITLPQLSQPLGTYVHSRKIGNLIYLSGKGPSHSDGTPVKGKLGADVSIEQGYMHARQVGLVLISALREALGGDLNKLDAVIKVLGMVNATPDFENHPKVINGCSDLFVEVFGERGKHARSAVGMGSLPQGIPVEIEAIVSVK